MSLPWICLISVPRSGTNQVSTVLNNFARIEVYLEWFRPLGPSFTTPEMVRRFSVLSGQSFRDHDDPAFGAWIHDNVDATLAELERSARPGSRAAMVKLFDDHLPRHDIQRHLFDRPGMHVLLVERTPIDTYVSFAKARTVKKWINYDTTDVRPVLDVAHFFRWHSGKSDWFGWLDAEIARRGLPVARLHYDRDIAPGTDHTMQRLAEVLHGFGLPARLSARSHAIRALGRLETTPLRPLVRASGLPTQLGLDRQDQAETRADKVANWDEFCQAVRARDGSLDRFERFFTGQPGDERRAAASAR